MAAISSISNGEALSSVRTKLNSVITEINLLDPTDWIDYSAISTVVGWSSFTTKIIRYRVIGKQVFVLLDINGISNSTTTTFTLPINLINPVIVNIYSVNAGLGNLGLLSISSNTAAAYRWTSVTTDPSNFTNSGSKRLLGQFFYEIA